MRRSAVDAGIDRLQDFLLAMAPGDEVSARGAAAISGLDHKRCDAVLDALMRAGLMMRLQNDAYVRCRLERTEQQST
jgi:predicted transcriptional regulator of viral defense system